MSIEIRIGDPEDVLSGMGREDVQALMEDPALDRVVPTLDRARVLARLEDPDWDPPLVPGEFMDVDAADAKGLESLFELLAARGFDDVARCLRHSDTLVVATDDPPPRLGVIPVLHRARLRRALESVASAIDYRSFGRREAEDFAAGLIPYNLEVLRHAVDAMGPGHWVHWSG